MKFDKLEDIININEVDKDNTTVNYMDYIFPTLTKEEYTRKKRSLKIGQLEGDDVYDDIQSLEKEASVGLIEDDMGVGSLKVMSKSIFLGDDIEYEFLQDYPSHMVKDKIKEKMKELVFEKIHKLSLSNLSRSAQSSNVSYSSDIFEYDFSNIDSSLDMNMRTRRFISKCITNGNCISTGGRIGPSQYVLVNPNTLGKLWGQIDVDFFENNNPSGKVVSDFNVPENVLLFGRKNTKDQPGIQLFYRKEEFEIGGVTRKNKIKFKYNISDIGGTCLKQYTCISLKEL